MTRRFTLLIDWPALARRAAWLALGLLAGLLLGARPAQAQEGVPLPRIYLPVVSAATPPGAPYPGINALSVSSNTWLEWSVDPAAFPNARFAVYLEADDLSPDVLAAENLEQPYFYPTPSLEPGRRYYWQVAVSSNGRHVAGPVWSFETYAPPPIPDVDAMVTIPAGEFTMGCDNGNNGGYECRIREVPQHLAWLDAYAIDRHEVTNLEYRACMQAGACDAPRRSDSYNTRPDYLYNPAYDYYPVLYVSWWNASDFCAWEGKRLPTEAEWEKAARGTLDLRPWPWGYETIDCSRANYTDDRDPNGPWPACVGDTDRIGLRPLGASPYGVLDMAGNVFEWVFDPWYEDYYRWPPPYLNPRAPLNNSPTPAFVIRGGSYRPSWFYPRTFNRHWGHHGDRNGDDSPFFRNNQVGFRCAQSLP